MLATNLKYRILNEVGDVIKNEIDYNDALAYWTEEDKWTNANKICAIPDGETIQFDIDTEQESELALAVLKIVSKKAYVLKTDKGIHIYFRKPAHRRIKTGDAKLLFGIKATIHGGNTHYTWFKNGVKRDWIDGYGLTNGEFLSSQIDEIPNEFVPQHLDSAIPLIGKMDVGERHNSLLKLMGFVKHITGSEKAKDIIRSANSLLREPLSEKEITPILNINQKNDFIERHSASERNSENKELVAYDFVMNDLLPNLPITMFQEKLYFYNGQYWSSDDRVLVQTILQINKLLTIGSCNEIVHKVKHLPEDKYYPVEHKHDYIPVKNGLLNGKGELISFTPNLFYTFVLDVEYDAEIMKWDDKAEVGFELVDKLDEIIGVKSGADKEELECFFAYTGYTLFCKNNKMKKMAQFVDIESKSNNGKSTIEDLVKSLLTNTKQVPMYSSKSMAKIDEQKNQFTYAEMDGKIANFDDEGNKNVLSRDNVESIKKLLTPYPRVSIEHKGIDSATVYLPIKLWVFSNGMLKSSEKRAEWVSKQLFFPFRATFTESKGNIDRNLGEKLDNPKIKSKLLFLSMQAWMECEKTDKFPKSVAMCDAMEEYKIVNNSVIQWINSTQLTVNDVLDPISNHVQELFDTYRKWALCNDIKYPLPLDEFKITMTDYFSIRIVRVDMKLVFKSLD